MKNCNTLWMYLLKNVYLNIIFACECGNTNKDDVFHNEVQGITVCTLCGIVLQTSVFYIESRTTNIVNGNYELFSTQAVQIHESMEEK